MDLIMGLEIKKSEFTWLDYERFTRKLFGNLDELAHLLQQPGFGLGAITLGAELELYIVDKLGRPLLVNNEVQTQLGDPQLTLELNRYNLEYNLTPVAMAGRPFAAIESEIRTVLARLNTMIEPHNGRILPIGILPTLQRKDFGLHAMTDLSRYHALTRALADIRGKTVAIRIDGEDPISLRASDVTLEGANTSLQMHYRVTPGLFADSYNAIQLVTPLVLATSANSPFLLGNRLWHETRIPLFKQAIDGSGNCSVQTGEAERVSFGHGWVRHGVHELFAETVYLHKPILPVCEKKHGRAGRAGDSLSLFEVGAQHALRQAVLVVVIIACAIVERRRIGRPVTLFARTVRIDEAGLAAAAEGRIGRGLVIETIEAVLVEIVGFVEFQRIVPAAAAEDLVEPGP